MTVLPETAAADAAAVSMRQITKRFPGGVVANDAVDFDVAAGEVHALLGENGAGKSTLSNVLTGIYHPDAGSIDLWGERTVMHSPRDALAKGIGMVHQHFHLVPTFTVAENIALGGRGRVRHQSMDEQVAALGARYGLQVSPSAKVWQLSVGEQQRVEILKALARDARVLILDEPTAVLTPQESEVLFETLRAMAADGRSVVFISHKLDEVMAVSDRITVLRDGRNVGTVAVADTSSRALARMMVGRDVVFTSDVGATTRPPVDRDRVVLAVNALGADGDRGRRALFDVSFDLHAGEIVAVCGVAGNGQRELAEAICATRPRATGSVVVDGRSTSGLDPRELIEAGVAHIPEDRLHTGLAASASIEDNLVLKSYRKPPIAAGPFVKRAAVRKNAVTLIERFGGSAPSPATPSRVLSGGNVQKVVLARELSAGPTVVIAASPTRGLDVGAIETVRAMLLDVARAGAGVLLITEELEEAIALAGRILVIYEGAIVGEVVIDGAAAEDTHELVTRIGLLMGGGT